MFRSALSMMAFKQIVYPFLLVLLQTVCVEGFCSSDRRRYELFGTKTFYEKVAGTLPSLNERSPEGCKPVYVYGVIRHGARYPTGTKVLPNLEKLLALAKDINSSAPAPEQCETDLQALRNWKIWIDKYAKKNLTRQGAAEMEGLALRLREFLSEIMGKAVNSNKFSFRSTNTTRTVDSMHAFAGAMLGSNIETNVSFTIIPDDSNYLDNEICPKYVRDVDDNPQTSKEYDRFLQGPYVTRIKRRISRRLGVPIERISNKFVWTIYSDGCYTQQWVEGTSGPWCSIFSPRDLKLLEYASDLEDYYERGFNPPISYEWTCRHVKEIIGALKNASDKSMKNESHMFGHFDFGHSDNVMSLAANLKLIHPERISLTADNFPKQKCRSFRMSKLLPSAANLVFVLYRCDDLNGGDPAFKVQTFWNEEMVERPLPCQTTNGMCDMDKWLSSYMQFITGSNTECNQDVICSV